MEQTTGEKHDEISESWLNDQLSKRTMNVYFDVEYWYPILQNQTFSTELIPISPSVAQAFVHFFQTRYTSAKSLNIDDIQLIQSIQNQLKDNIYTNNRFENKTTFVRLSARSPKDGRPLNTQGINGIYQQKMNELRTRYSSEYVTVKGKANMQLNASYYAQFHSLKVTNEMEALNLILSSERVYHDLIEVLDCQKVLENKSNIKVHDWNNHLIIREWNNRLDPSMEFRCFVYQSNLTAISQYNYYCKYYHLQDQATVQQIKSTIIQYWRQNIKPLLDAYPEKYANYVIDIGLLKNLVSNEHDCIVIEMNPFHATTNPSLFNWTTDIDQLQGNGYDVEIRVRSDYYPYIEDYIDFILEINHCNKETNSTSDNERLQPYFIFLKNIKAINP